MFHALANLPTDHSSIAKALTKRSGGGAAVGAGGKKASALPPVRRESSSSVHDPDPPSMEGSVPAAEAEPGTLQATLVATPGVWQLSIKCWKRSRRF